MARHYRVVTFILILFLFVTMLVSLCIGRYNVSLGDIIKLISGAKLENDVISSVILTVRAPRILLAVIIGAGLSTSGASLQSMFSNPLVSSHILGVSASAAFGAALGILLFDNFAVVQVFALIFGFVGMSITYALGRKNGRSNILMLVLSGIVISAVFEALISLIKYTADPEDKLPTITYWLMGSLSTASIHDVYTSGPIILSAVFVLWLMRWRLNAMSLGDFEAISLGLNLNRNRAIIIVSTTIIAAVCVSVCGLVSFIGLAVPHMARMIVGNDNKRLIPTCILLGGAFMVIIDTIARSVVAAELPLSVLTALVGAPIFVTLLRRTGGAWSA